MTSNFLNLANNRRTIYALGKDIRIPEGELISTIKEAVKQAPSAFNSQSSRILILLGEQHIRFWELTREQLRKIVPAENFSGTSDKIDGFAAAAGSVLFFEDQDVIKSLQEQFAAYADNFPVWSEHSTGIAQYAVWLALAEKGVGANLQHYNPLVDDDVRKEWNVPSTWKLRAHMNFGAILSPAAEKAFMSDEKRYIVAR
ncbi:TPA: nitroreductase family protein [Klebsiella michiganensis]|uniref:Putative nitroreductase HBN1 n=1 Tax=Thelohanellus kitauei TaxID=669202 RepID=A0A0C2MZN8_THEKT|nr:MULTISPECIES: nitroreductase family protein [Klebsiella]KII72816.1 putative nitroreductase HBN1 [Thelohanellus kitauei]HDH7817921.1 nitroreductase family protein [Raoultella ornithinolytica]MBW6012532.1 nitroreductase family protein [Klebsiella sp. CVUAS 11263]MBW6032946.1 nitroreductase family protein [Klebsiella sp. CVUAS 11332]MBZ6572219.1 nitroreductase family protein [Klebsiella grimontii]